LETLLAPPAPIDEADPAPTEAEDPDAEATAQLEPTESAIEPDPTADNEAPAEEAPVTFADAIASFADGFQESLAAFLDTIDAASQLPPLSSPPNGNGVAYDKFLAIYNDLLSGDTDTPSDTDGAAETGAIDEIA